LSNLNDWFYYDPDTGIIRWKKKTPRRYQIGEIAGRKHNAGYLIVRLGKRSYLAHRLAWFLHYGYWPPELDHKDHDRKNNRIDNLRVVTRLQNQQNSSSRSFTTSQYKGVSWDKARNKWSVYIKFDGKVKNLGRFDNELEASLKYDQVAKEKFGEYATLNHPSLSSEAQLVVQV